MKLRIIPGVALVVSVGLLGCSTAPNSLTPSSSAGNDTDQNLTKKIDSILIDCQKIKPGMTRAELLKVFDTEGGLSQAKHRTFVYRGCPEIQVDVDFTLAEPGQGVLEERPTDIISKISQPYLGWYIND